jgi:hypothetical protein
LVAAGWSGAEASASASVVAAAAEALSPNTEGDAGDAASDGSAEVVDAATEGAATACARVAADERFGAGGALALMNTFRPLESV